MIDHKGQTTEDGRHMIDHKGAITEDRGQMTDSVVRGLDSVFRRPWSVIRV
jgi:hypothetical protein